MWRFILLAALGLIIGSRTRSERGAVVWSALFGLLYGAVEVMVIVTVEGWPSPARVLFLLGLGLVLAAPVYAIAELWRRTQIQAQVWLRRLRRWWREREL
jgi:hypothetical protein